MMKPIEASTTIRTASLPIVERWDVDGEDTYLVTFEDADVSVRLTGAQLRAMGARILSATLDEIDD